MFNLEQDGSALLYSNHGKINHKLQYYQLNFNILQFLTNRWADT